MDRVLFFFAGGEGFWWAVPPLLLLLALSAWAAKFNGGMRVFVELALVLSGAFVFLGGPPVAGWVYLLWVAAIIFLLFAVQPRVAVCRWPPRLGVLVVAGFTCFFVMVEWPYLRMNSLPPMIDREIYVIGDSLTAGIAAEKRTWPTILHEDNAWRIVSLAVPGARLHDAAQVQAPRIDADDAVVILMIGGNDLVKRMNPDQFKLDLEELIEAVAAPDRLLVMVELPTIPGYRVYARHQRTAARHHGITLIPRQYLAGVFMTPEATVDGLHFSDAGHKEWVRLLLLLVESEDP